MEPHYIRCIKPNSFNKPSLFEQVNVLQQLRCGGKQFAIISKFLLKNQPCGPATWWLFPLPS
jgi:hypothetical protein